MEHFEESTELKLLRTKLTAGVPEGLRVEVGRVHTVGWWVNTRELLLVEADERRSFLLHQLMSFGLAEGRNLPVTISCKRTRPNEYIFKMHTNDSKTHTENPNTRKKLEILQIKSHILITYAENTFIKTFPYRYLNQSEQKCKLIINHFCLLK